MVTGIMALRIVNSLKGGREWSTRWRQERRKRVEKQPGKLARHKGSESEPQLVKLPYLAIVQSRHLHRIFWRK